MTKNYNYPEEKLRPHSNLIANTYSFYDPL